MVLIDGKKATVHWPDSGGPAEITAPPGEHVVQVKKDGFTMKGQTVTVEIGGKTTLIVELEPLGSLPPKKGDDGPARSAVAKPPAPSAKMDEKKQASTRLAPAATSEKGKRSEDVVDRPDGPAAEKKMVQPAVILLGSWRVDGQELVQSDLDRAGTIILGDKELSSYDMKFQGQIVTGNEGFVALFHYTDGNNLRFFHVGELDGKRADLGLLNKGQERSLPHPTLTEKGRWYKVWVKVRGAECWCYLDGQMLLHDVDKRFTKGRIGLATWDANARYRDIAITTPEGKVLWSGLPQLPGN
jgi:hypothetical protein